MAVLGRSELKRRLDEGVFVGDTWLEENLRGAAYDLRVAGDYLILPNGKRYWSEGSDGHQRLERSFWLKPGNIAFVTSVEKLAMPDDLAGNVAVKFRNSLDGILVMGGFLVDPGYVGRLHFQLANIGQEPFKIEPEKTSIAALQLLPVLGDADLERHPPPANERLLRGMFNASVENEQLGPLAFFTLRKRVKKLERRLDKGVADINVTKRSMDALVVFGVIVIFAAILAALVDKLL
jgi:deoxycytidine triphosphate deaminase